MGILGLKAQPEDVFCLVADVLDDIIDTTEPTQEYIDELWTSILLDIQQWSSRTSIPDRMLTAGTVFYIVRELLGHHWVSRFNDTVYYMMSDTLERRLKVEDKREEELFLQSLLDCSRALSTWINSYDTHYGFLSEEIEDVVEGRKKKIVDKEELNFFAPKKNLQEFLKGAWIAEVRTDAKYDTQWTDSFIEALMKSEYGEDIARQWAVKGARNKRTLLKAYVAGLLKDAGVLKGSYVAIGNKTGLNNEERTFSTIMSRGKKQPYAEWVKEYVAK